tara:strand:- start:2 stop:505 length:504 start_codon:yes stop_codon:yes gene_type:complete
MTEENTPQETTQAATTEETAAVSTRKTTPKSKPSNTPADGHWWWGTGRRKAAVARVRIRPGDGAFTVNNKDLKQYFTESRDHKDILAVLEKSNAKSSMSVHVKTNGGGYTGQAGAIILGLGRALAKYDPSLESMLRENGYLTRDPRQVERKKPGQPGARRRFQFSKR